jgi:phosphoglycolate phosphatase-like HAD superfamily hydrolase
MKKYLSHLQIKKVVYSSNQYNKDEPNKGILLMFSVEEAKKLYEEYQAKANSEKEAHIKANIERVEELIRKAMKDKKEILSVSLPEENHAEVLKALEEAGFTYNATKVGGMLATSIAVEISGWTTKREKPKSIKVACPKERDALKEWVQSFLGADSSAWIFYC